MLALLSLALPILNARWLSTQSNGGKLDLALAKWEREKFEIKIEEWIIVRIVGVVGNIEYIGSGCRINRISIQT